jgi:hypothetical protein
MPWLQFVKPGHTQGCEMWDFIKVVGLALILNNVACSRFEKPTSEQCKQAVSSLVSHSVGKTIEKEFPQEGEDAADKMATAFLKGMGQSLLTGVMVDANKIAWCELHMSVHDVNCLRAAQSMSAAQQCGYKINESGDLAKE